MQKICPKCNTACDLDAAFCPACGHRYRTQFSSNPLVTGSPSKPPATAGSPAQTRTKAPPLSGRAKLYIGAFVVLAVISDVWHTVAERIAKAPRIDAPRLLSLNMQQTRQLLGEPTRFNAAVVPTKPEDPVIWPAGDYAEFRQGDIKVSAHYNPQVTQMEISLPTTRDEVTDQLEPESAGNPQSAEIGIRLIESLGIDLPGIPGDRGQHYALWHNLKVGGQVWWEVSARWNVETATETVRFTSLPTGPGSDAMKRLLTTGAG